MVETITEDVTKTDLKGVVSKLLPDATAKDIEKASQGIYPLHDVYIRKVSSNIYTFVYTHVFLQCFNKSFRYDNIQSRNAYRCNESIYE